MGERLPLHGIWRIDRFELLDPVTGERHVRFGDAPRGFIVILPEGRMMAVVTPSTRPFPESDAERARAFAALIAYSGRCWLEGEDSFVTAVDVAWNEAWIGTEQRRFYRVEGDRLTITTPPLEAAGFGHPMVAVLTWTREQEPAG